MERHFEHDLEELKTQLLTMASHAEAAVQEATEALLQRDDARVQIARARDNVIDRLELEVDDAAISLLSRAPLATDLRTVTVAMKISQNLERVGDEATKIAKRAHELNAEPPLKDMVDIAGLSLAAVDLLKAALDTFVQRDTATAREIISRDKAINALNKEIHRQLIERMMQDREAIPRCLNLMVVAKALERVGDHAANIAEEVVFLYEAQDIRHAKNLAPKAA
jgi:phosphate transport system protein